MIERWLIFKYTKLNFLRQLTSTGCDMFRRKVGKLSKSEWLPIGVLNAMIGIGVAPVFANTCSTDRVCLIPSRSQGPRIVTARIGISVNSFGVMSLTKRWFTQIWWPSSFSITINIRLLHGDFYEEMMLS